VAVTNRRAVWTAALAACGLLVIVLGFVIVVPHLLYPPLSAAGLRGVASARARIQLQQAQSQLANNARSALLQGLAGFVIVAGAAATWWQVHISRHGQLTERFTKAVDQLGSENVTVRIGAIYALERLAKNSAADRDAVLFLWAPSSAPAPPGRSEPPTARSTPPSR